MSKGAGGAGTNGGTISSSGQACSVTTIGAIKKIFLVKCVK